MIIMSSQTRIHVLIWAPGLTLMNSWTLVKGSSFPTAYLKGEAAGFSFVRRNLLLSGKFRELTPVYIANVRNRKGTRTFAFQVIVPLLSVVATPKTNAIMPEA